MSNQRFYIDSVYMLLLLMVAGAIYIFLRQDTVLMTTWFDAIIERNTAAKISLSSTYDWIQYSLPESLWIIALCMASRQLYISIFTYQISMLQVIPIVIIGFECLQYLGWLKGTFDIWDIVLPMIAWLICLYAYRPIEAKVPFFTINKYTVRWMITYAIVCLAHHD